MESIAQRFDRLAGAYAATIDAVPADRWGSPSPCAGWTARDVVRHSVDTPPMFYGFIGKEPVATPPVDDDPAAAFAARRAEVQGFLDDPEVAGTEFDGFFGRSTFEQAIDDFLNLDLVVHRWDLAQAARLDDRIEPADLRRVREAVERFGEAARRPGVFGAEVASPPGADEQARVLAFLGRQPVA